MQTEREDAVPQPEQDSNAGNDVEVLPDTTALVLLGGLCFGLQQDGMKCRATAQSVCLLLLRAAEYKTDCIHTLSLEAPCSCYKE